MFWAWRHDRLWRSACLACELGVIAAWAALVWHMSFAESGGSRRIVREMLECGTLSCAMRSNWGFGNIARSGSGPLKAKVSLHVIHLCACAIAISAQAIVSPQAPRWPAHLEARSGCWVATVVRWDGAATARATETRRQQWGSGSVNVGVGRSYCRHIATATTRRSVGR